MGSSTTAVFDIGSHSIKCGLSSSTAPQAVPTIAGACKYRPTFGIGTSSTMASGLGQLRMVGLQVMQGPNRGLLRLTYPVQHGVVQDWGALSILLQQSHEFARHPRSGSVAASGGTATDLVDQSSYTLTTPPGYYALVEHPFSSRVQRQRLAEMLFEVGMGVENERTTATSGGSGARGIFCGVAPLLSLYSTGETSGVVLDVGEGVVSTAAALQGFALTPVMQREDGGATGGVVTAYLEQLMRVNGTYGRCAHSGMQAAAESGSRGPSSGTQSSSFPFGIGCSAEREILREVKEVCCQVAESAAHPQSLSLGEADDRLQQAAHAPSLDAALVTYAAAAQRYPAQTHLLPDGTELRVGREAYEAPEVLFQPSLVGSEARSIVEMVLSTVATADMDVRPALLQNVLLTGGGTMVRGLGPRFLSELLARTPRNVKVRVVAPAERGYAAWLGAAFLSQLSSFPDMLVTREEYQEAGESILHARLFA